MVDNDNIHSQNIMRLLEECPPGLGHRLPVPGLTFESLRDGETLPGVLIAATGSTTPFAEVSSNKVRANLATGKTIVLSRFTVPPNYDDAHPTRREFQVQLQLAMASASDSPSCALTFVATTPDGVEKTGYSAGTKTGTATTTPQKYTWDIADLTSSAGERIKAGDSVTLTFTFAAHAAGAIYINNLVGWCTQIPTYRFPKARRSTSASEQT